MYADALLDRQDPRGELIHLQVAQSRVPRGCAEYKKLARRIEALTASGWAAWTPKIAGQWEFTRGFPTALRTTPAAFLEGLDDCFAAAPLLDTVSLDCGGVAPLELGPMAMIERLFDALARSGRRLATLRLESLNDAGAVVLAGQEGVRALTGLELVRTNLGTGTYEVLGSEHSTLRGLRRLELTMANARDVCLAHLFGQAWPRLESLVIGNEVVGVRGMQALTAARVLPSLQALDLSWSVIGGEQAMGALAGCPTLPGLAELDLSHCAVTDGMAAALAGAGGFSLKVLRLAHSGVGPRGVRALLDGPACAQLALLDLTGVVLDEATRDRALARLGEGAIW